MADKRVNQGFAADDRAVSAVVGFILIFGILVLTLSVYQAQIVPQQNAQTEFEHFEESQNELIELRNSISTAGQTDVSQFPSVTLGTNYQTRLLTINPAPPAGTLQTSEKYNITISNGNPEDDLNISTRFLEYQPGYNEITVGPTQYEHSVLYLDERDRGNNVRIIEDQHLVKDGTVRITPLQNEFQQTGTDRVTLELYPQEQVDTSEFPEQDGEPLNVTIPTQLDEDEYWNDALEEVGSIYQGVDTEVHGEEIHALNLSVEEDDLEVNTVGIQLEPDESPAKNTDPRRINNGGNGGDGDEITEFESVFASNIGEDRDSSAEQIYRFILDGDLDEGEEVDIDLSDADRDADRDGVTYPSGQSESATVNDGSGEADYSNSPDPEIIYTAGSNGDNSGVTVEIELGGIDTDDEIAGDEEYEVEFTYNGVSETTTFEVE